MINHPDHTTEEDILAISKAFNIPVSKIEAALYEKVNLPKKVKKPKIKLKTETEKSLEQEIIKNKIELLKFSDFEDEYIHAHNKEEEIIVIKKFVTACMETKQAKSLYELCPEDQVDLRNDILLQWVKISKDTADIREVKPLTKKGTPAGDLAYRKFINLF